MTGFVRVDIEAGGHTGSYGRAYVHASDYGLGRGFSDVRDVDVAIAKLLDDVERRYGIQCVAGTVSYKWDQTPQDEMALGDRRVTPDYKPGKGKRKGSKSTRAGKRHSQQYSVPGDYEREYDPW